MAVTNYTIIIPHKNIPDLLRRCVDSIPYRDDIQIIIVDDNSDHSIVDFARFPELDHPNTEVYFTKEGKGAGYARNIGLEHAKGKWLVFADADDFFTDNAFDYLVAQVDSPYEIIYFKVTGCYSDTYQQENRGTFYNQLVDDYTNKYKDFDNHIRYQYIVPWGKMVRRELVEREKIRFEEVIAGNNLMFSIRTGYYASSVGVCNQEIYCSTIRKGNLSHTLHRDILTSKYLAQLHCNEFFRKHNKHHYQGSIMYYIFSSCKYGIGTFFQFVQWAFVYKSNLFRGINRWFFTYISMKRKQRKNKKYFVINY